MIHPLWSDALRAVAIMRDGGGALLVRASAGPVRDRLIAVASDGLGATRLPAAIDPALLEDGLDPLASLAAGRPVRRAGLLSRASEGVLVVPGVERLDPAVAAAIGRAIERGARVIAVADGDEPIAPMLDARLVMRIDLAPLSVRDLDDATPPSGRVAATVSDASLVALCEAAAALGIGSIHALRAAARVLASAAATAGRATPDDEDHALTARLVLAPIARTAPDRPDGDRHEGDAPDADAGDGDTERDLLLDAALAVLPPGLLSPPPTRIAGSAGGGSAAAARGPAGRGRGGRVRAGLPVRGARLDLVATLAAAAPWQRARGRGDGALVLRRDDVRVRRPRPRVRAATIFAVDASGSSALARLAEVKGAVERLLTESYVRRDEVALVAFRRDGADLLLPPTRALARARRELAALPGGGGTPLAAGLVAALAQALRSRAAGRAPLLVLLTDGAANVARDRTQGRAAAEADALAAGRAVARAGIAAVAIDSSARGDVRVAALATAMAARLVRLPYVEAGALGAIVRAAR